MNDRIKEIAKQNGFSDERAERITEEIEEFAGMFVHNYANFIKGQFEEYRFDKNIHLGLGDIRLTVAMQKDIIQRVEKQDAKLQEAVYALREWVAFAKENDVPVQVKHLMIAGMLE